MARGSWRSRCGPFGHDAQLDAVARRFVRAGARRRRGRRRRRSRARAATGAARCRRPRRGCRGWRSRGSSAPDRAGSRDCATRRCGAAYSRNQTGSSTHVRSDAGAENVASPRTRSSCAAATIASVPPRRNPANHTPVTSVRACNASIAARTSASQPSIEKSPSDVPVPRIVNVSAAQPASRAMRSTRLAYVLPTVAAPPGPRGNPGRINEAGHACEAGGPREVRAEPQAFRDDLLEGSDATVIESYPGVRDRHARLSRSPR